MKITIAVEIKEKLCSAVHVIIFEGREGPCCSFRIIKQFSNSKESKTSELQSKVVSSSLRCNGISDCDDGSDEENCFKCQTPFECPLSLDNSTSGLVCLNGAQLCDRIPHCPDKFDEVFYCSMSFPLSNDRQFIPCNNLMPYIIYWFTICKDYQISSYGELIKGKRTNYIDCQ